jgi:hypothetical protein
MADDDQGDLFSWNGHRRKTRADQIYAAFRKYHLANPIVYELIEKQALERIRQGYKNYGIAKCIEDIRWTTPSHLIAKAGGLKIRNDFRAYYARMFHAHHPEHAGFFRTRKRPSTDRPEFPGDPDPKIDPPDLPPDIDLDNKLRALITETL